MKYIKNCKTNSPSWDDTPPEVRHCAPSSLSSFLWHEQAPLSLHIQMYCLQVHLIISLATVNRSTPPPPEISWHIKAPEGGLILECTTKMWDPHTHARTYTHSEGVCVWQSALTYLTSKCLFILTWKLGYDGYCQGLLPVTKSAQVHPPLSCWVWELIQKEFCPSVQVTLL